MTTEPADPSPHVRITWQVVLGFAEPAAPGWARVRDAQFAELVRMLKVLAVANLVAMIVLVSLCWGMIGAANLLAWAGTGFVMLAACARFALGVRNGIAEPARATLIAMGYAGVFGLLWTIPPALFAHGATIAQQLAICLVATAMMGLVTLTCSSVPAVTAVFVLLGGAGLSVMMGRSGSTLMELLPLAYAVFLGVGGAAAARSLVRRCWAELALDEQQQVVKLLLREFEDNDADWLWEVDTAKLLRRVNGRLARAARRPADTLEGTSLLRLLAGDAWERGGIAPEIARLVEMMNARESFSSFAVPVSLDGEDAWWSLSAAPRHDERGTFCGFRGVGSDVTEQRRSANRIEHAARFDALTGLSNRAQFMETARRTLGAAHRDGGTRCALLLIDLDKFKPVNDTLGHPVGDRLLQRVAERIASRIGARDIAGRLGGDEFAVLVRDEPDDPRVSALADAMIATLTEPFEIDGHLIRIGASIGSGVAPRDGRSIEALVRNADLALYRAKNDGRGCHRRFGPALLAEADRRRAIESALREALDADQFNLVYQPLVEGETGRIVGFEALIRWTHPSLGEVAPVDFLLIAEEARLTTRLGAWVLRTACEEAAGWPDHLRVAVNLSFEQLTDGDFVATVTAALGRSGLAARRLELDISEHAFLRENGQIAAMLDRLKAAGVRIALDDFGTGYAALGYVRHGRFDSIKIDQAFVRGAARNEPESLAIVRAVVAMANSLGIVTVAEGLESEAEYRRMRELGCRQMQGHLSGMPVPAEAIRSLLGTADDQANRATR